MDADILKRHFGRISARAHIEIARESETVRLDIRRRGREEVFHIEGDAEADLRPVDVRPSERHLLLMNVTAEGRKEKFLCGHDERHWFVAAVPETGGVSNVATAMEALKPRAVRFEQERAQLARRDRHRRRNAVFIRQGEWFFVPAPSFQPAHGIILRHEPISRGGKPHLCEELSRTGGERVYTTRGFENGLTELQWQRLIQKDQGLARRNWQVRVRNPDVFVRGRIRHPDHATIRLHGWHQVLLNTENQAPWMHHVAFID